MRAGRLPGIVCLLAFGGVGTGTVGAADVEPAAPAAQRGAAILAPFKRDLQAALKAGLAEGPVAAIDVCRIQAPALAAANSAGDVSVGRSSHRLRNPANAPAPWMEEVLADYLAGAPQEPRVVHLDDGTIGYAEPIVTQPPCVTCHGESLAPALQQTLARLYPQDQATGFRVGELRGIFWARFPGDTGAP